MQVRVLPGALSHSSSTIGVVIGDTEIEIPDLAEPIVAWRCWALTGDDTTPVLQSPASGIVWPPVSGWDSDVIRDRDRNFISAYCRNKDHPCESAPSANTKGHIGVGCGIYAYKTIEALSWDWPLSGMSRYTPLNTNPPWTRLVWGRVLLWGRVFEHDRGYRAQFARVDSLVQVPWLGFVQPQELATVAEFYGVGYEVLTDVSKDDLEEAARRRQEEVSEAFKDAITRLGAAMTEVVTAVNTAMISMGNTFKAIADALADFGTDDDDEDDEDG